MTTARRAVTKGKGKNVKGNNVNGRYVILAGLVIVLVIVVSYVTRGALHNEIPAGPAAAVTEPVPAREQAPPPPEPEAVTVVEGVM